MTDLNPWLQYGAFGLLAAIVLFTLKVLPSIVQAVVGAVRELATEFTAASKQARDDFREERRDERAFMEQQFNQNRASIGGLARCMERQTVATIASSKGDDVDEALKTHEKRNGGEQSGGTYAGVG